MSETAKKPKVVKPEWEIGTIVEGRYNIGYNVHVILFEVVRQAKGKPPVVKELEMESTSEINDYTVYTTEKLKLPKEMRGEELKARWQPAFQVWGIQHDTMGRQKKVKLEHIYKEGREYKYCSGD